MALQKLLKLEVKRQFSHHLIRKSEHCPSVRRTAKIVEIDTTFLVCISLFRVKIQKFTGVCLVYSLALSLQAHFTAFKKMKSLKWLYLQLIYLGAVKLG